jgi:hypothetical protein
MEAIKVLARWDPEAGIWWAASADIKALVAESETVEGLLREMREIVRDLMQLNHGISESVQINLIADCIEAVRIPVWNGGNMR